jgi:hypothetical protein
MFLSVLVGVIIFGWATWSNKKEEADFWPLSHLNSKNQKLPPKRWRKFPFQEDRKGLMR